MAVQGAHQRIHTVVTSWEGVSAQPHRFGGTEFSIGKREIGHMHGDKLVDIPFPSKMRDELVASGRAQPHHILPDTGWVSFFLREPGDVDHAIELLHLSYEIATRQKGSGTTPVVTQNAD
jgi:hypothetical protein